MVYRIIARGDEDTIVLTMLHVGMRTLHAIARTAGSWALLMEQDYNDIVSSLH